MIQRARDTDNAAYITERKKDNQYVTIFGGSYSYRNDIKVVNTPYNETFKRIATLEILKDMLELEGDAASNIISYAGSFQKVSADEIEQAVKDADIQDPQILMTAAQSYELSIKFIEELTQHPDVSVANAAKETLKNR